LRHSIGFLRKVPSLLQGTSQRTRSNWRMLASSDPGYFVKNLLEMQRARLSKRTVVGGKNTVGNEVASRLVTAVHGLRRR